MGQTIRVYDENSSSGGAVDSVNGQTGVVVIGKADVGLGNVDNTSDLNKPISTQTQTALDTKINLSEKAVANGVATLDAGGTIPQNQIPFTSNLIYLGTWDASINTPTLVDGVGNTGEFYICNVAGTVDLGSGPITFDSGDWNLYNGSIWEKSDNTSEVVSVHGRIGNVVGEIGDYTTGLVSEDADKKYVTDAEKLVISNTSGTNTGDETALGVKTKYESNADTNAFTDAEKTNLSNQSNTNTGDETTASIQLKRQIKTVNGVSLEGSGNALIPTGQTYSKIVVFEDATLNNFNSNVFTDIPGLQILIDRNGDYTFSSILNCNNDQNEEIDLAIALTPINERTVILSDGSVVIIPAGSQFTFLFQAVRDSQRKNQDQTLNGLFLLDGLLIGDLIDFQLDTRNDNVDLSNRRAFGYTIN